MSKLGNVPHRYARYAEIMFYEDASGWQTFKYGKLGEVIENIRTFALPFENQTYTFKMQYEYDSWNRIQEMTYPDGEVVHYDYNLGGMLEKVYGTVTVGETEPPLPEIPHDSLVPLNLHGLGGQASLNSLSHIGDPVPLHTTYTYSYIDSIAYNEFEQKSEVFYGNGTHTQYDYDDIQRLQNLQSQTRTGAAMQSITYSYDAVNNITDIVNMAGALSNGLGGIYSHYYEYDDLYRLINSHGQWDNTMKNEHLKDTVRMAYYKNGRIASKKSYANIYSEGGYGTSHATQNSRRAYNYNIQQPNTLSNVYDSVTNTSQNFSWDNSGNMVAHNGRSHSWTEDNRLLTVADNEWFSYYQYDAGGDRTYKLPYNRTISNRSGRISYYWAAGDATLYASPYLVVTPKGYTKHYYAESERITSQIGRGNFSTLATPVTDTATANRKVRRADSLVLVLNPSITDTAAQLSYLTTLTNRQNDTCEAYWYHPDHLGSSSWITDSAGNPVQHLHYLPWGEDYVNQRLNDFDGVRYTFSAKEKDSETGLSYFGSRYYNSDLSIWLSVDPMSDKYPSLSPYVYCADNPVKLVDPNGEDWYLLNGEMRHTYEYTSKKAFDEAKRQGKVSGRYMGKYYYDNKTGIYYGLFGDQVDAKSNNGKLVQKIDEAFLKYVAYHDRCMQATGAYPELQNSDLTDFNRIYTYKCHFGTTYENVYDQDPETNEYFRYANVATVRFTVTGTSEKMFGHFGGFYTGNSKKPFGSGLYAKDGYHIYIVNGENKIIGITFGGQDSFNTFREHFRKLFGF